MKFERIIDGKDHLWAVRDMTKPHNELAALFQQWNDAEYLWDFFLENMDDLQEFFHIERVSEADETQPMPTVPAGQRRFQCR